MDAVARSKVTLTTADYREWLAGTYLKQLNSVALSVSLLLAFMCLVLLAFDVFFHIANHDMLIGVAIVVAALVAVRFAVPVVSGLVAFRHAARRNGGMRKGSIAHDVALFGDRIEVRGEGDVGDCVIMRYDEVEKVNQTAHLFVITCKKKGSLLVKKEAFSADELAVIERLANRSDNQKTIA